MDRRLELHALLVQILGSNQVYFQPKTNTNLQYPCIVYQWDDARTEFAGNKPYSFARRYSVTYIDREPDSLIPETIAWLPKTLFDRSYTANNLHHSVFTLYF